jgi:adenylate kinase family enzyme
VKRIAVIGAGGAGKTRLARALGAALDLPVVHLDAHYHGPGWRPLPPTEWADRQRRLAAADRWVMDGNYAGTLPLRLARADTVVFLDLPPLLCAWRVVRRWMLHRPGSALDLPPSLRPKLGWRFLVYVLTFRRRRRPALLAELARWEGRVALVTLSSRRAATQLLASLTERGRIGQNLDL